MEIAIEGAAASGRKGIGPVVVHNHKVAPKDRFEAYQQYLVTIDSIWQSRPHRVPPSQFLIKAVELRGSSCFATRVNASPVRRTLTRDGACRTGPLRLRVVGFRSGRGVLRAGGKDFGLGPFSLGLSLTDQPSDAKFDTEYSTVCVEVPIDRLTLPERDLRRLSRTVLAGPHAQILKTLFFPAARTVLDSGTLGQGALDPDGVDHYLVGLVDLFLRSLDGRQPDHVDTAEARRSQIESYIRANITDPNLSALTIANVLGMSARRVFSLFEGRPESLHDLVQSMRVEHAERLLSQRERFPLTLDRIARESGFGSVRTLNRAFQRVHNTTPSERRAQSS